MRFSKLWFSLPNFPILWRAPYGGPIYIWPDEMGIAWIKGKSYESHIVSWILENAKPHWNCIDIGASQGFYTFLLSKLCNFVTAFEPNDIEFKKLKKNQRLRKVKNIDLINRGLGNLSNRLEPLSYLPRSESRSSFASLLQADIVEYNHRLVKTQVAYIDRLDDYKYESIDLIKIDVEGSEIHVIQGGRKTIRDHQPVILIELADVATEPFGYLAHLIEYELRELNYRCLDPLPDYSKEIRDTFIFVPRETT